MIRAIIIDDEPRCISALQGDLEMFCPEVAVLEGCHSGKEGLLSIKKHHPDLIFLDVEMPWMNGFEMLEVFGGEINFKIIFTTAYDQFAARAFRVSAVDYLLKPIDSKDLMNAVQKVKKELQDKEDNHHISNLLQNVKAPAEQQRIAIPTRSGYSFIPVNEIMYCKGSGAYTTVYLSNQKNVLLSKSVGETEQLLPAELFERVHNSVLVNIHFIDQFVKSEGAYVVMKNGDELSVSKSKKDQLLLRLGIR
ncbi:MAG TPA: LytTR family DNA-binding domain-containing protein [Segetibacter sp.]